MAKHNRKRQAKNRREHPQGVRCSACTGALSWSRDLGQYVCSNQYCRSHGKFVATSPIPFVPHVHKHTLPLEPPTDELEYMEWEHEFVQDDDE